jgi:hypothetical protein
VRQRKVEATDVNRPVLPGVIAQRAIQVNGPYPAIRACSSIKYRSVIPAM